MLVQEYILRFQIPVRDAYGLQVPDGTQDLLKYPVCFRLLETLLVLASYKLRETVAPTVLHQQVNLKRVRIKVLSCSSRRFSTDAQCSSARYS